MDVIEVPAVPKEAFNKQRRISDLIKAQVAHLKHVEQKLPASQRAEVPQGAIVTENDAAIYIAAMTRLLRAGAAQSSVGEKAAVVPIRPAGATAGVSAVVELAAEGAPSAPKKRAKKAGTPRARGQQQ